MRPDEVRLGVLGPLEVRAPEGVVRLGGHKERALLALLLLRVNTVVPRERLIDELWGEEPPETAVESVQVYVSRLRKVLPAGMLVTRSPGYALEVDPAAVDLHRFETLVAEARAADTARAAELLRAALGLWRGPALAEFASESFGRVEGARLDEARLAALEQRIELDLALSRHDDLVGELEALVREHPHRERLRRQLMLTLYRSGRQAEALAAYRAARDALDELGLEPSAELRLLERRILSQDAALEPSREKPGGRLLTDDRVVLPGPLVPESPFPFVGREPELHRLRSLLERARAGEGALVLLSGEPGAGKTRLAREFAREAAGTGVLVCYGMSDAAVTVPYQPLREWLEFLQRVCDPAALARCIGDDARVLARIAPTLAAQDPAAPGGRADVAIDRYSLQTAVVNVLRRLSAAQPVLLVADDVHWADDETLSLLGRLARAAPEGRALVVATLRLPGAEIDRELGDTLADLSRLDGVTRLPLERLGSDDLGAFVHDLTDADASTELLAAIEDLTDGTPLLVCELWRDLVARDAVAIADRRATLSRPAADLRGPERIGELLQQRLARLSAETGRMIELAAATGPRFPLAVVAAAADLDHAGMTAALEQATRAGIVEDVPATTPTGRFTHELVRRAIYDRISSLRRAEIHDRVGRALEARAADTGGLAALAHHFALAAPVAGKALGVEYNLRAAEAATASLAYREAAARFETALGLGIDDPHERTRIQLELGYLYFETGRMAESDALLSATLDAATTLEERGLATRALVHLADQRLYSDPGVSSPEMVPVAEEAIGTFEQLGDLQGLAKAEILLGHALGREGRSEESFAALDRAFAYAESAGDRVLRRDVTGRMARQLCENSPPAADAIVRFEELRTYARDDPVLDAGLRRCLGYVLAMAGRFDEAREHLSAAAAVLDRADETGLSLSTRWYAARAKLLMGDVGGAEQDMVGAFLCMRDSRGTESEARALRVGGELAVLYCDDGRWHDARECLAYGQELDDGAPVFGKIYSVLRLTARARLAAHEGRVEEALRLGELAVEVAERSDWLNYRAGSWLALAEVQRARGRTAEADAAAAEALRLYELKGNVVAAEAVRRSTAAT